MYTSVVTEMSALFSAIFCHEQKREDKEDRTNKN